MNEEDEELVESTESVETLWQMAAAENPQDENLLYLMQGVGSDRDRKLTLAALLAWIVGKGGGVDAVLKSLQLNKSSGEANLKTLLDGEGIKIEAEGEGIDDDRIVLNRGLIELFKTYTDPPGSSSKYPMTLALDAHDIDFKYTDQNNVTSTLAKIYFDWADSFLKITSKLKIEKQLNVEDHIFIASGKYLSSDSVHTDELKTKTSNSAITVKTELEVEKLVTAPNIPTNFVNVGNVDPGDASTYLPLLRFDAWEHVGAVKRFLNQTANDISFLVFKDTSATFHMVKFPAYSYRELVCIGSCTSNNIQYAVLMTNGAPS